MNSLTPSNAQTALLDLELSAVALCGEGANSRADIILNKSRKEKSDMPKTFEELMKALEPDQAALVTAHVAALELAKNTEITKLNGTVTELTGKLADVEKNKPAQSADDILKNVDPAIRTLFEKQKEQIEALVAKDAEAIAQARFEKCKAIPMDETALKNVLKTASPAVVEVLEKAAVAISTAALEGTGTGATGTVNKSTAAAHYSKLEKAAQKLQSDKGITFEAAFMKACEEDPETYEKYREEVR